MKIEIQGEGRQLETSWLGKMDKLRVSKSKKRQMYKCARRLSQRKKRLKSIASVQIAFKCTIPSIYATPTVDSGLLLQGCANQTKLLAQLAKLFSPSLIL